MSYDRWGQFTFRNLNKVNKFINSCIGQENACPHYICQAVNISVLHSYLWDVLKYLSVLNTGVVFTLMLRVTILSI